MAGWGQGHVDIDDKGNVVLHPDPESADYIDLAAVTNQAADRGVRPPFVLRVPRLLEQRVHRINEAFRVALKENDCKAAYRGVFPVKVNQNRLVVQTLAKAGRKWKHGLEVGSKAELVAALTMDPNRSSLLIINGYKDRAFVEAACHATRFKDNVIIVIDEIGEIPLILPLLDGLENPPLLGLRLKLRTKAPGKWALSGGLESKFGLTVSEVMAAVESLREAGHLDQLAMLHYHIGSQISDIRRISAGTREAARIHVELVKMGVGLRWLDVGGGLAVDYDGSGSSSHNSANYTVEEYASTVVATVKETCDAGGVAMPGIISESGRAVVAPHAILVTRALRMSGNGRDGVAGARRSDDPVQLTNLYDLADALNAKNVFESFHDANQYRDDLQALFDLGHLGLEALARGEDLFMATLDRMADILVAEGEEESEEYRHIRRLLRRRMVVNFSLFQSLPDVWGVKQQFPVLPLHRHTEVPTLEATLADITCDSDGEVRRFIDPEGTKPALPIHKDNGRPYYLGAFLVGAYQDSLGDYHNLFGETAEVIASPTPDGGSIDQVLSGSNVASMLEWVRYDPGDLRRRLRRRIDRLTENGRISKEQATEMKRVYQDLLAGNTYLEV